MPSFRKNKPLLAAMANNLTGLKAALDKGADPGQPGPSGMTALHMAVLMCSLPAVEALLAAGAPLEARDKNDLTPLGYAVLPARETPLAPLRAALKSPEKEAALNASRAAIRKTLLAAGANWDAASAKAPTPRERFAHYWPDLAPSDLG